MSVIYYNTHRTHQGLKGQTPIKKPAHPPVDAADLKITTKPVPNGLYHTYDRVAQSFLIYDAVYQENPAVL